MPRGPLGPEVGLQVLAGSRPRMDQDAHMAGPEGTEGKG